MRKRIEANLILEMRTLLANLKRTEEMTRLAGAVRETLNRNRTIYFSGMGRFDDVAKKVSLTYSSRGMRSSVLSCANALYGDVGCLRPDDMVILMSEDGSTKEAIALAKVLPKFGAVGVSMTCEPSSELALFCAIDIVLECEHEPTTLFLVVCDAIGAAVADTLYEGVAA